jgi:hypothetical protein
MYPYRYWVTLKVWHPTRDLAAATKAFGIKPRRSWTAGQPRQTPKGTPLPGVHRDSYWYADLTTKRGISSKHTHAEVFLEKTIKRLGPARAFLSRLRATGGRAELLFSSFGKRNYAVIFDPVLLLAAGRLGVILSVDIYPVD